MIKKVLIANRGEIALRVMRSCREMGLLTVAVFSEADRTSHHVAYADEAYPIGPAVAKESYLNIEKVIATAKRCGADAIHPGYGFLSENSEFARRCKEEGIIFIGPAAETMEAMGDKIAARKRMIAAGVPVVPGTEQPLQSAEEAVRICNEIGYPVMLKASMGGGGKGMRLIHNESEVVEAYNTARSESMSSFGDDTVYLEKFVEEPHHIEFQILGDNHGNVIHLFDRECSVQRRNQKVVEESPSPFLTPELRREMGEKAVAAAKAVNYSGAGTIEFLVDKNRRFYFLEMNTRLQVEHPITEEVVGVDLVKEQIRIANDEVLHLKQEELFQRGHAIECRICAEDTENNFMPSPGVIKQLTEPNGIGVRIDSYVYDGYEIPIYYVEPNASDLGAGFWAPPSAAHPLGTDDVGRDLLARLLCGGRVSLLIGLCSAALSALVGIPLGLLAGYRRGAWEFCLMRLADVFQSFPSIVLVLCLVSLVGPSALNLVLVLGLLGWTGIARLVYGNTLSVREKEYVLAARALAGHGTGPFRIYGQVSVSGRGKGTLLPGGNAVIGPDYL